MYQWHLHQTCLWPVDYCWQNNKKKTKSLFCFMELGICVELRQNDVAVVSDVTTRWRQSNFERSIQTSLVFVVN